MNQYGVMAQKHWARFLPTRYARIEDPDNFFSTLGQEVEEEIDELATALEGEDPPDEDYLGKLGRLNAARQQAREKVLAERVLLPAEPGSPMDEDSEEAEPTGPPAGEFTTDWIPLVEDPNHPWWREQRMSDP
jgi:hypothetical protein